MKKLYFVLLLIPFLFVNGCKKKDEGQPAPEGTPPPPDTYNPPPTEGGYYFFKKIVSGELCWTKNFSDNRFFSSKLKNIGVFGFGKDTVLVYQQGNIYFGNIFNPADFKSITCSRYVKYISCINNVVVCYAEDNNNYYLGYCDYKNGERAVTFNLLTNGEHLTSPIQYVGDLLIAGGYNNSANLKFIAITRNGKTWSYKGVPYFISTYSDAIFKNYNNTYYSINPNSFNSTTDTSFASGSWSTNFVNITQNTSDSSGYFQSMFLRKMGTSWISFGSIHSSVSGKNIPAKNVSTDNGVSFTTSLLNGLPSNQTMYDYYFAVTKTHVMAYIYDLEANNGTYKAYISTDFLNFSQVSLSGVSASMFLESNCIE